MNSVRDDRKFLLLVNPAAGQGRSGKRHRLAVSYLTARGIACESIISRHPGDLTGIAKLRLHNGARSGFVPAVCGGDGSFHEVLNGLPDEAAPLGIIPCGTGRQR